MAELLTKLCVLTGLISGKSIRPFSLASIIFNYPELLKASLVEMVDLISNKKFDPVITKVFPLSETAEAHKLMENGKSIGKIIFEV